MKKANVAIALAMAMELVFVITGSLVSVSPLFAQTNETNGAPTYDNISSTGNTAATTTTTKKPKKKKNTTKHTKKKNKINKKKKKKFKKTQPKFNPLKLTAEKKFSLS